MTVPLPQDSAFVSIRNVTKRFGAVSALNSVSIDIRRGEFFSLLGPSGCGKTTLMRLIAGFEQPDAGSISVDGSGMAEVPPHQRPVNMMFQSYALFPHLSVWDNIAFGVKRLGLGRTAVSARVDEMLALTQLGELAKRKPDQLSGGQRQRVALARALARQPKVLLLDEPLGALDKKLRRETQAELKRIQILSGATFIVVTHDQEEAMALSDRIAVMRRGQIVQVGAPGVIYDRPVNRYVADFIGDMNLFPATVAGLSDGRAMVAAKGVPGTVTVEASRAAGAGEGRWLAVRPEKMQLAAGENPGADHWIDCQILDRAHLGAQLAYRCRTADGEIVQAVVAAHGAVAQLGVGSQVAVGFRACDAQLLTD
jgi:putrescine transport system ATP-binding protein